MQVLRDLVDPGLEGDRPLGLAHPAQRGDEDLLGDVLGACVVLAHAEHVRVDPAVVAAVKALEGAIVPATDRGDQLVVGGGLDVAMLKRRRHLSDAGWATHGGNPP
jgi:hypothetical protein